VVVAILTVQKKSEIDKEEVQKDTLPKFNMEEVYQETEGKMTNWCSPSLLKDIDELMSHVRTSSTRNWNKRIKRRARGEDCCLKRDRKRTKLSFRKKKTADDENQGGTISTAVTSEGNIGVRVNESEGSGSNSGNVIVNVTSRRLDTEEF
jgi:hypothetical protein